MYFVVCTCLLVQDKYDQIGTNGYITTEPSVVTFKGFEVKKLNVFKVRVKNTSQTAQRIHILPPKSTELFKIKYKKKGYLAPGLHQEILVNFTPTEHKYFYDTIRIHTKQQ